jgi:protein-L-isoaspartate O-methyltransferase
MLKPQMQRPLSLENRGWPEAAPFDAIIVNRVQDEVQEHLIDLPKEGGCMIIPVGEWSMQNLYLLKERDNRLERQPLCRSISCT